MKYNHPTDIPMSKALSFEWIGELIYTASSNVHGDTYPVTWADDDELYTGVGDPCWRVINDKNENWESAAPMSAEHYPAMSGAAFEKIIGKPETFEVYRVNDMPEYTGFAGNGAKPCGMVCVDGVIYYAIHNLLGIKIPPNRPKSQHGSDATIIYTKDYGKTWLPDHSKLFKDFDNETHKVTYHEWTTQWLTTEQERESFNGWQPMFPGSTFGGPSFVQFGKNNEDAVDGYVYAVSGDQWDNGRFLRLGRVPKDKIMDRDAWEFFTHDSWQKDINQSSPILDIDGHIGLPEMVYIKSLKKYILLTWALHKDFDASAGSELTILEGDNPWGPFSLAHYDWMWYTRDNCPYTPRIPLKWFNQQSLEGYILQSGKWASPYYIPQIRKFAFRTLA
ncbi:MAG: DUF4185 domain-containing protein [Defluviitaleaceae bacterium]|nr:DUF4185 domain-containing protein [Defluviitaleaceae bacterium]